LSRGEAAGRGLLTAQHGQLLEQGLLRLVQLERRLDRDVGDQVAPARVVQVLDAEPAEARTALTAIETASRSALDEVRLLLRQIREPAGPVAGHWPGLADLAGLARQFQDSGLRLSYRMTGQPGRYGESVELSAYRIAQEALTNAARHAAAASTALRVECEALSITVSVTDDGPGGDPDAGGGLGLAGMRERVALHGGEFRAGPRPDGGFEVHAVLPAAPLLLCHRRRRASDRLA